MRRFFADYPRFGVRLAGLGTRLSACAALVLATALVLALVPARGTAQQATAPACAAGVERIATIGITSISCRECGSRTVGSVTSWRFEREPEIAGIERESPAAEVLEEGDLIVAVDGLLITSQAGGERFSALAPGERVKLRVRRGGVLREPELPVYAYCRGAEPRARLPQTVQPELPQLVPEGTLGIGLGCSYCRVETRAGRHARWRFGQAPEILGVDPNGPAARAGLRQGDVLLAIDGESLLTIAGGDAYSALRPGQAISFTIRRDGKVQTVALTVGRR